MVNLIIFLSSSQSTISHIIHLETPKLINVEFQYANFYINYHSYIQMRKLFVGSDHAGLRLKEFTKQFILK